LYQVLVLLVTLKLSAFDPERKSRTPYTKA
jgi:hypothetical protein